MAEILKKLAAVVFLTMLIWAWAYLALEDETDQTGTLDISAIRQDLFVNFEDQPAPVSLKLTIKGPTRKIAELKKRLRASDAHPNKERLDFLYDPASQNHSAPGSYELDVVEFLNNSDKRKDMAVTIVSCEPSVINIKVEKLTEEWLPIQCLDEDRVALATELIDPQAIQMLVRDRDNWTGTATVILTEAAIEKARQEPVTVTPFIELTPGKRRYYKDTVDITLPATENPLEPRTEQPTIGFIGSKNLWDKYTVQLINESDLRTIRLKASERAFNAYEKTAYQVLVEILPGDETAAEAIHRPVIYNFPEEFVQKGEIKLDEPPREAVFKLVARPAKPE